MDNQFSNFTQYPKNPSSPKKRAFIYVGVFVALIAGAIFLGNYYLSSRKETAKKVITPTPILALATPTSEPVASSTAKISITPTVSAKPSPTPTGIAKKIPTITPIPSATNPSTSKTLLVEVLNGSGTSGQAVKGASLLKAAGYLIKGTGNADAFTYPQTVIQIKKTKATYGAQLKKDLSTSYTVDPVIQTLAESSTSDAIVIIGAK